MLMRAANSVELVVLLLGASASLLFLPDAVAQYGSEPEDLWLLLFWLTFCYALGSLCVWNALSGRTQVVSNRKALLILNWIALVLLAPVFLGGMSDTVLLVIGAVAAVGPITQLLHLHGTATGTA